MNEPARLEFDLTTMLQSNMLATTRLKLLEIYWINEED